MESLRRLTGTKEEMLKLFNDSEYISVRSYHSDKRGGFVVTMRIPDDMKTGRYSSLSKFIEIDKTYAEKEAIKRNTPEETFHTIYREKVRIEFSLARDQWELTDKDTGEILDQRSSIPELINNNNCLR